MSATKSHAVERLVRSFPVIGPKPRLRSKQKNTPAVCTIIAKNRLASARVLARSLAHTNPQVRFFVLIIDPFKGYIDLDREPFEVFQLSDLMIADIQSLCMRYSLVDLATAVKPRLLEYIFEVTGCRKLVYLDPDILVLNTLDPLFTSLEKQSILLTPHITRPIDDDATPGELNHLRCGLYNLGFVGLSATKTTTQMLSWWKQHLYEICVIKPEQGFFHDQKWMDLAPLIFPEVEVVTDPGCNVAYWNLQEREVTLVPEPRANKNLLRFFHFSGYDPNKPHVVSKYQDRFEMSDIGAAEILFSVYRALLREEEYVISSCWPYFFNFFNNGAPITVFIRDLFESLGEQRRRYKNPFDTATSDSFFAWINGPAEGERSSPPYVTNALHFVWSSNPLLRARFPRVLDQDRESFLAWAAAHLDPSSHPIGIWRQRTPR